MYRDYGRHGLIVRSDADVVVDVVSGGGGPNGDDYGWRCIPPANIGDARSAPSNRPEEEEKYASSAAIADGHGEEMRVVIHREMAMRSITLNSCIFTSSSSILPSSDCSRRGMGMDYTPHLIIEEWSRLRPQWQELCHMSYNWHY